MTLRAFSFGGGVQSVACLVLAAQGRIDFKTFVFSNVGDDSEHPGTLRYLEEYAKPFAELHGLELITVHKRTKDGEIETLFGRLTKEGSRSLPIPVRMSRTGAPGTRSCTADFKIKVIAKFHKDQGATPANPAVVGIGISLDEFQRMRSASGVPHQTLEYPLIDLGLDRADCERIIAEAGLPVPPKSSCWFCPFHTVKAWARMRDEEPELFERSVQLERMLNDRRAMLGKDPVYFSSRLKPLDKAFEKIDQLSLFGPEEVHSCAPFACSVDRVE